MLKLLGVNSGCWKDQKSEFIKLKVYAYKELEEWIECAKVGSKESDPEVQKWVKLCERRASG